MTPLLPRELAPPTPISGSSFDELDVLEWFLLLYLLQNESEVGCEDVCVDEVVLNVFLRSISGPALNFALICLTPQRRKKPPLEPIRFWVRVLGGAPRRLT